MMLVLCSETGCHIAQTGFELNITLNSDLPASSLPSARVLGMALHAQFKYVFYSFLNYTLGDTAKSFSLTNKCEN